MTPPFPLSRLTFVIVSQSSLLEALQPQPVGVWTPTLPVPPLGDQIALVGDTAKLHGSDPRRTGKVWLAIMIRPVIPLAPLLLVAVKSTVPFPVPLVLPVKVIQLTRLTADQLHPGGAFTFTEPTPPLAGRLAFGGEIEKAHDKEGTRATKTVESCE